ncbi:pseudouridylate synthase TRUB2, mitochondrial [Amyelois transitella]|uniref:pseudouridylate synthase TRUB2, mitochondrial n=1 Tax=Amyelois transitella TaxID=680683 RepID=UPI0029906E06|nr:pseudouridylate synthase TRUB2, mitochondrial [Amyelois transitella]
MGKFNNAVSAFKALNGLICVYKPPTVSIKLVQHTIITNLCRDLNKLPGRLQEKRVEIVGPTNAPMDVKLVPNLADDPLVCGPRYLNEDFRCSYATHLGLFSSGVLLIGINAGTRLTYHINVSRPTRAYKVHGQLGKATDTYFWNGKTVERATYGHVTRAKIDEVVAHMQSAHQKTMYELSGIHKDSQTGYELASQGLIRPANSKLPLVYGIKCVHFAPPDFTLEIQAVNEYDRYLWTIVHDMAVQLKTAAHCTGLQCIRQGRFTTDMALLRKHWQLPHILDNMDMCHQLIEEHEDILQPQTAMLSQ